MVKQTLEIPRDLSIIQIIELIVGLNFKNYKPCLLQESINNNLNLIIEQPNFLIYTSYLDNIMLFNNAKITNNIFLKELRIFINKRKLSYEVWLTFQVNKISTCFTKIKGKIKNKSKELLMQKITKHINILIKRLKELSDEKQILLTDQFHTFTSYLGISTKNKNRKYSLNIKDLNLFLKIFNSNNNFLKFSKIVKRYSNNFIQNIDLNNLEKDLNIIGLNNFYNDFMNVVNKFNNIAQYAPFKQSSTQIKGVKIIIENYVIQFYCDNVYIAHISSMDVENIIENKLRIRNFIRFGLITVCLYDEEFKKSFNSIMDKLMITMF